MYCIWVCPLFELNHESCKKPFSFYCSNGVHSLPHSYVYLLIPGTLFFCNAYKEGFILISNTDTFMAGLFSNHSPLYFVDTKRHFSKLGLTCHIAKIHSEVSAWSWMVHIFIKILFPQLCMMHFDLFPVNQWCISISKWTFSLVFLITLNNASWCFSFL